jgi:HSP20 family protein
MLYTNFIRKSDPWRELERVHRNANRMFNSNNLNRARQFPPINVWNNENEVIVTAEVPGFSLENINLSLVGNELTLNGKKEIPELKENEYFHRHERRQSKFDRKVQLPFMVDRKKITARLKDGVLKVELPRAESDKPINIQIKTS